MTGDSPRFSVRLTARVAKQIAEMDGSQRHLVEAQFEQIAKDPQGFLRPLRKIKPPMYKRRQGNLRMIVYLDMERAVVLVLAIGNRDNIYADRMGIARAAEDARRFRDGGV